MAAAAIAVYERFVVTEWNKDMLRDDKAMDALSTLNEASKLMVKAMAEGKLVGKYGGSWTVTFEHFLMTSMNRALWEIEKKYFLEGGTGRWTIISTRNLLKEAEKVQRMVDITRASIKESLRENEVTSDAIRDFIESHGLQEKYAVSDSVLTIKPSKKKYVGISPVPGFRAVITLRPKGNHTYKFVPYIEGLHPAASRKAAVEEARAMFKGAGMTEPYGHATMVCPECNIFFEPEVLFEGTLRCVGATYRIQGLAADAVDLPRDAEISTKTATFQLTQQTGPTTCYVSLVSGTAEEGTTTFYLTHPAGECPIPKCKGHAQDRLAFHPLEDTSYIQSSFPLDSVVLPTRENKKRKSVTTGSFRYRGPCITCAEPCFNVLPGCFHLLCPTCITNMEPEGTAHQIHCPGDGGKCTTVLGVEEWMHMAAGHVPVAKKARESREAFGRKFRGYMQHFEKKSGDEKQSLDQALLWDSKKLFDTRLNVICDNIGKYAYCMKQCARNHGLQNFYYDFDEHDGFTDCLSIKCDKCAEHLRTTAMTTATLSIAEDFGMKIEDVLPEDCPKKHITSGGMAVAISFPSNEFDQNNPPPFVQRCIKEALTIMRKEKVKLMVGESGGPGLPLTNRLAKEAADAALKVEYTTDDPEHNFNSDWGTCFWCGYQYLGVDTHCSSGLFSHSRRCHTQWNCPAASYLMCSRYEHLNDQSCQVFLKEKWNGATRRVQLEVTFDRIGGIEAVSLPEAENHHWNQPKLEVICTYASVNEEGAYELVNDNKTWKHRTIQVICGKIESIPPPFRKEADLFFPTKKELKHRGIRRHVFVERTRWWKCAGYLRKFGADEQKQAMEYLLKNDYLSSEACEPDMLKLNIAARGISMKLTAETADTVKMLRRMCDLATGSMCIRAPTDNNNEEVIDLVED